MDKVTIEFSPEFQKLAESFIEIFAEVRDTLAEIAVALWDCEEEEVEEDEAEEEEESEEEEEVEYCDCSSAAKIQIFL